MTITDIEFQQSAPRNVNTTRVCDAEVARAQVAEPTQVDARDDSGSAQVLPTVEPSEERPDVDPALFERAREAVSAIRGHGRRQNGQAAAGNTIALKTGLRSAQLLNAPDIAAWHTEQVNAITADLGGDAELSSLARGAVREAARLEVILAALGSELLAHGVLTGKGKTRAATSTYLHVLDRYVKLTGTLGLERRTKPVQSASAIIAEAAR
jgi:hypothetical protein